MDKKINLLRDIEAAYNKRIISSIVFGCFGVIFTLGLSWGTFTLHNENMFSAEPNLFGEIIVLINTIILAAASIGLFTNAYNVLDIKNKFLKNENYGVLSIRGNMENKLNNSEVLKSISYDDIVIKSKNVIITDNYIITLGEEPYIDDFNNLEAVYRNINDDYLLDTLSKYTDILSLGDKADNSNLKLKLVFTNRREHIEILLKCENDIKEFMEYLYVKGVKTYKGINSYYSGNYIETENMEEYLAEIKVN